MSPADRSLAQPERVGKGVNDSPLVAITMEEHGRHALAGFESDP
jgi:hypothetical protein